MTTPKKRIFAKAIYYAKAPDIRAVFVSSEYFASEEIAREVLCSDRLTEIIWPHPTEKLELDI